MGEIATGVDVGPSRDVIRSITGGDDAPTDVTRTPLDHRIENMTTRSLDRFTLVLRDGTSRKAIAKTLQPAWSHPDFATVPPEHRPNLLDDLDWTDEPRLYQSGIADQLPPPLGMPTIHGIDTSSDLTTIWMEDVADAPDWDLARYERTASALGRLGGTWHADDALARFGLDRRDIGRLFFGKVLHLDLVVQSDDAFWSTPIVADTVDEQHRRDLFELAERMPDLIARLAELPEGVCHGDASPDNFREPGDRRIVAIDWSYGHVGPLGSDLGQLAVGRIESGAGAADDVEPIFTAILDAYVEAVADRDGVRRDQIELAGIIYLAIRSVFSALLVDHRPDLGTEARAELLRRRAAMARFGLDRALRLAR